MTLAATSSRVVEVARPDSVEKLSARVLSDSAVIAAHHEAWCRLAAAAHGSVVFQTPNFVTAWSNVFTGESDRLMVVLVYSDDVLVGLIPVEIQTRGVITTARVAGAPVGQYDDALIHPAVDPTRVVDAACDALRMQHGVDVILFTRVRSDSALAKASSRFVSLGEPELAPYAELGDNSGDAFVATLKSRVRRQLAKRKRQLDEIGACEFAQATDPDQAADWMREALDLKRDWLCQTGRLSQAFADPRTAQLLIAAAREGVRRPGEPTRDGHSRVVVSRLSVDGKTAALEVGFVCGGTYHFYLGTFAPEFAKFGPGNVLTEAIVRACAETGIRRYDMLAPDSRNKREWANGSVEVADLALPLTALGRLHALIVHQGLRPAARRMFYLLPNGMRSRIAGRVLAAG